MLFSFVEPSSEAAELSDDGPFLVYADCVAAATRRASAQVDAMCSSGTQLDEAIASSFLEKTYAECEPLAKDLLQPPDTSRLTAE